MPNTARVHHQKEQTTAKVIGSVPLDQLRREPAVDMPQDDFLMAEAVSPWANEMVQRQEKRIITELEELFKDARWDDIIALVYPLQEKVPELVQAHLDVEISLKAAFALDHIGKFEEAIALLQPICKTQQDHYFGHYNLAYVAYNALYNSKNRKILLHRNRKVELRKMAHHHFQICQQLRSDGVTPFYREGILWQDIENNTGKAMSCFARAISNWEKRTPKEQENKHQERPKYIRALYHLAGCCLNKGQLNRSLKLYKSTLTQDKEHNYIAPVFKYYSLGKNLHELGECKHAMSYLETAATAADRDQDTDFIYERAARCALELGIPHKAEELIGRIPQRKKRPYVHWTEADTMTALNNFERAKQILHKTAERDRRSKHKALLRLAKICYRLEEFDTALVHAQKANTFCRTTFGNESREITFWQAAILYRLGDFTKAECKTNELRDAHWRHPQLHLLHNRINKAMKD